MSVNKLKTRLAELRFAVKNRIAAGKKCTDGQWDRCWRLREAIQDASAEALEKNKEALNDEIVQELEEPCDDLRLEIEMSM